MSLNHYCAYRPEKSKKIAETPSDFFCFQYTQLCNHFYVLLVGLLAALDQNCNGQF